MVSVSTWSRFGPSEAKSPPMNGPGRSYMAHNWHMKRKLGGN